MNIYRCNTAWGNPGIVSLRKFARGKALKVAKPVFPPRAPPFRARKLLQVVEMCSGTGGAMDAAVLDMKHCADLFLFSTTFPVNHLLPPDHKETQPFHPAVQRSTDSSSNPRGPTQPHPNPTSQATTLTYRPNPTSQAATLTYRSNPISRAATLTYRPEKPAREACAACRRTLQEGSRFPAA